ncbi:MAG: hypothetical protein IPK87_14750 [Planctomycetes bacterium]|nr:hypothetical protein [Planctomycetota bacterium]
MKALKTASLVVIAVSLAIVAGAEISSHFASAQAATKSAEAPAEAGNKGAVDGVAAVRLASDLAKWGRTNKNAAALAVSAAILDTVPMEYSKELEGMLEGGKKVEGAEKPHGDKLIAEAKKMCNDDALPSSVMDGIRKMGLSGRGATKGAIVAAAKLDGATKLDDGRWNIAGIKLNARMKKGELAAVWVGGEGNGEIDLYIYDAAGKLVASDESEGDSCWCEWTPAAEADYTIIAYNRSTTENTIVFVTN